MAYSPETKHAIRADFIKGLSLAAAADKHGVPYATARGWKYQAEQKGDDWDTARAALRISSGGVETLTQAVIEDFVHLFQSTLDELKDAKDIPALKKAEVLSRLSDAYQKTVSAAGKSDPRLSRLSIAMDVLQKQMAFVRDRYAQHLGVFMEVLEPFGEVLAREFG